VFMFTYVARWVYNNETACGVSYSEESEDEDSEKERVGGS